MKQDQAKTKGRNTPVANALKSAKPAKPAKPVKAVKAVKVKKGQPDRVVEAAVPKKDKLVRDSFTLPREDFELIAVLKDRALDFKRPTKKSELLRAGLQVLAGLDQAALRASLEALRELKAGRPKHKA